MQDDVFLDLGSPINLSSTAFLLICYEEDESRRSYNNSTSYSATSPLAVCTRYISDNSKQIRENVTGP